MPHAVDEVVREREAEQELDAAASGDRHAGERGREARALNVPAQQWGHQVRRKVGVRSARQGAPRDARPGRVAEPGLVELVDAEVGGDRPVEALLGEDLLAFGVGDLGGRDGAGGVVLVWSSRCCWGERFGGGHTGTAWWAGARRGRAWECPARRRAWPRLWNRQLRGRFVMIRLAPREELPRTAVTPTLWVIMVAVIPGRGGVAGPDGRGPDRRLVGLGVRRRRRRGRAIIPTDDGWFRASECLAGTSVEMGQSAAANSSSERARDLCSSRAYWLMMTQPSARSGCDKTALKFGGPFFLLLFFSPDSHECPPHAVSSRMGPATRQAFGPWAVRREILGMDPSLISTSGLLSRLGVVSF